MTNIDAEQRTEEHFQEEEEKRHDPWVLLNIKGTPREHQVVSAAEAEAVKTHQRELDSGQVTTMLP